MATPAIIAQGNFVASTANDFGDFIDVTLPAHQADDILVLVCEYYPSPASPIQPSAPSGWTATSGLTYDNKDRVVTGESVHVWWWRRAVNSATPPPRIVRQNATGAANSDTHLSGCAFVVRGCITAGDPFEGRNHQGDYSGTGGAVDAPPVTSTTTEGLAILIVCATHSGVTPSGSSAQGYVTVSSKYSFIGAGAACVLMSRSVGVATIPAGASGYAINDPGASFNGGTIFGFVAIPTADIGVGEVPVTVVPIRGMARGTPNPPALGCADEYEAIITSNDYETRVDAVRWSSIEWDRVLDDVSEATVVVPDEWGGVACCAKYGGLVPWRYGLTIERNGQPVWKGPVTKVLRQAGKITVKANDALVRYRRRLATRDESLRFVENDAGQMFADILNVHGRVIYDAWQFDVPQVNTGVAVTRNVVAREFNYAWDVVEDLLDSAIDATVIAGVPVVFQPGVGWVFVGALGEQYYLNTDQALAVSTGGDTLYGLFTQEAFTEIPEWTIDGMTQANTGWLAGADSGQAGFRKYWTAQVDSELAFDSVLDIVETDQLYRAGEGEEEPDDSVFQRRVDSIVALRAIAPAVIDSVSLSASAPINVENLRPGTIWTMDVYDACWGQLLGAGRVKRISGSIQAGEDEKIAATLQPLGYSEGDL